MRRLAKKVVIVVLRTKLSIFSLVFLQGRSLLRLQIVVVLVETSFSILDSVELKWIFSFIFFCI